MQVEKVLFCFNELHLDNQNKESVELTTFPARTGENLPPSLLWETLKRMPFLVQFEFSDGTLIAIDDLLRSEYRFHLLPQQRLLGVPQIYTWTQFFNMDHPYLKNLESWTLSLWSYEFVLTYLEKYKGVPWYFVQGLDPRHDRKMFPIENVRWAMRDRKNELFKKFKDVAILKNLADVSSIDDPAFQGLGLFNCEFSDYLDNKKLASQNGVYFWNEESKTLYFNDLIYFNQIVQSSLKRLPQVKYIEPNKIQIIGSQNLKKAMEYLKTQNFQFGTILEEKLIDVKKTNLELRIYDNGIKLGFHIEDQSDVSYLIWNFSSSIHDLLNGWDLGFRSFLSEDQIISKIRKFERGNDLRFIRHVGIFNFYLFEVLHFLQFKEDSLEQPYPNLNDLMKALHKRSALILMSKEGFADANLKLTDYCSSKLIQSVEKWSEELQVKFNTASVQIYSGQSSLNFKSFVNFQYKLVYHILRNKVMQTQGDIFLRAQSKFLPKSIYPSTAKKDQTTVEQTNIDHFISKTGQLDPRWCYTYPFHEHLNLTDWLVIQKEFKDAEIKIYFNDKNLEEVDSTRLKAQIDLVEQENIKNENIDWFELNPRYFLDGQEIPKEKLLHISSSGIMEFEGKYYLINLNDLPGLKVLNHFWAKILAKKGKKGKVTESAKTHFLKRHQTLELLALRKMGVQVSGGPRWKEICDYYDRLSEPKEMDQFNSVNCEKLRPFQRVGFSWLYDLYNLSLGGVLADDMGLGKTAQALNLVDKIHSDKKSKLPFLIVVPTSLTYNWIIEAEKFTPDLKLKIFEPKLDEAFLENVVYVTTYGLLLHHKERFLAQNWHIVLFDEAQNLKTWNSQRAIVGRDLKAQSKFCLTGTPLENHMGELYSILNIVMEGVLGSKEDFYSEFVNKKEINAVELDFLKLSLKPLILRRHKQEILKELPDKIETSMIIPFSEKQKKIYRDVALSCNEQVQKSLKDSGESRSQLLMLTALLRLRQICSDPAAVPQVEYTEVPPKVESIVDALNEIIAEGHSVLIFTQFIATYERLIRELKKNGVPVSSINGSTSRKDREVILQEFQSTDKAQCLIMTLKTGGVGLNLTKASYVFHVEPWWNPAVENQATDRAHRMGQKKIVNVYRLIMKDSVEEKIEILKKKKVQLFNSVFDAESFNLSPSMLSGESLRKEDFDFLLDLRPLDANQPTVITP